MNRVKRLLLGLCLITPTATMAAAPAPEEPALELLEFLGEWDGESEAWLRQQKLDDEKSAATPKAEVKRDE
jgi:hypothetical protein